MSFRESRNDRLGIESMGSFRGFGVRRRRMIRLAGTTAIVGVLAAMLAVVAPPAQAEAAGSPCGATVNAIVCENQQPGTDPDVWDIDGAGDSSIQGFATDISVKAGARVDFKVDTDATAYTVDIYRTGWYQGLGARKITSVPVTAALPQHQPECLSDVTTELYDCGTWGVSASWNVPSTAVSGVYIASLQRTDTGGQSHIIFVVRNDASTSDVVFQTSDTTWQAYNTYGGASFYQGTENGRAYKLSYNRPFATRGWEHGRDFYFSAEFATVRFLERNGYDLTYIAGADTDRNGAALRNHNVFLSVGHDEYWSGAQRANVEQARDAGVNLQFLSGNEMYWRTRWEADSTGRDRRTLVSYKETWSNAKIDPSSEWTGTWRDPRISGAAQGGHSPENAVTGTMYTANNTDLAVTVSAAEGKTRLWRNTSLAMLPAGSSAALAAHTVGYESNEDVDNGDRPAGLIRLSTTVGPTPEFLTDYGNVVVAGTTTHHLTMYRTPDGALVFSAGSVQWGWGLDATHDGEGAAADPRIQQAQINLLADMGAQPGSRMPTLAAASVSADTTAPVVSFTSPQAGAALTADRGVVITGTASDVGGVVAGVEISTDAGITWHPASGTSQWTYTGIVRGSGAAELRARAVDDSGNFTAAGTSLAVTAAGPHTFFGDVVPPLASADDVQPVELGLRFAPESDGFVAGVRFYKGALNTGLHTGTLWGPDGTKLGSVTFTGETATGWQTAAFAASIPVIAGQEYTVSYTAPAGGYAQQARYWPYLSTPSSPLATGEGIGEQAPGVFGVAGHRPTSTWHDSNYFVDVVFTSSDTSPMRLTQRTPAADYSSIDPSTPITATLTRAAVPATVGMTLTGPNASAVPGSVTYDATTRTIRFLASTALAPLTRYTVTPAAGDAMGASLGADAAWSFTTRALDTPEGTCPCTLFPPSGTPSIASAADSDAVTVGVRVIVSDAGTITGLRYYRGTANTGPHVGTLWDAAGNELGRATFADDSVQGWQIATFTSPVTVHAGQAVVASYLAPAGGYAVTAGRFAGVYTRGPLSVPANGALYSYTGGLPTSPSSTDYGIDVVFERTTSAPVLVSATPQANATDVPVTATISARFSGSIHAPASATVTAAGIAVAGSWSLDATASTAVFTPTTTLPAGVRIDVALGGIQSTTGLAGDDVTWSFETALPSTTVSFFHSGTPAGVDSDGSPVELGLAFTTSAAGEVRAIRFYKTAGSGGVHTGSLWGPNGQRLATVTFTGETATGWQRAALDTPVTLTPGLVYTVSYFAPQGRPGYSVSALQSAVISGPLSTIAVDNGRYRYGSGGVMPVASWSSTNYFVDVEFTADDTGPLLLSSIAPARGATDVPTTITSVSTAIVGDLGTRAPDMTLTGPDGAIAGSSHVDRETGTLRFTPTVALPGETTIEARVRVGGSILDSWQFTTAPEVQTLFRDSTPVVAAVTDTDPVEVGTAFSVSQPGVATAIRFFKGTANTGAHRGTLWGPGGELLAQVAFADETESGWQRAGLTSPVSLVPGERYVVSYLSSSGRYSYTSGYFASPRTSGFITAPGGANGLFVYGPAGGYPAASWGSTGYFVDAEIAFGAAAQVVTPLASPSLSATPTPTPTPTPSATPTPTPGAIPTTRAPSTPTPTPEPAPVASVIAMMPGSGALDVAPTATISATFDLPVTGAEIQVRQDGALVAGVMTYDEPTRTVIFTPNDPLAWQVTCTIHVTVNGSSVAGGDGGFTTADAPVVLTAASIFGAATPQNAWWNDTDSVQVATRFTVSAAGAATGVRFYKGDANTGLHTGYLWGPDGTPLSQVTFIGETSSGWQEMAFATPVELIPGVEYRVGLHSTSGRYAVDLNALAAPTSSGIFATPASGSAYTYSTAFPDATSTHNFWVDVLFTPTQ